MSSIVCVVQPVFFYAAIRGMYGSSSLNIVVKSKGISRISYVSAISHYTATCYCWAETGSNGKGVVVFEILVDIVFVCCCLVGKHCHNR